MTDKEHERSELNECSKKWMKVCHKLGEHENIYIICGLMKSKE
jgi:hypothetical protein